MKDKCLNSDWDVLVTTKTTNLNNFNTIFLFSMHMMKIISVFQKCKICRKKGDDSALLLCDECNQAFHMHCLRPALFQIPKGDWLCPACDVSCVVLIYMYMLGKGNPKL